MLPSLALSQDTCDYQLRVTLRHIETKEPIYGAIINFKDSKSVVYSNAKGIFEINNKCDQTVEVKITHPLYESYSTKLNLIDNDSLIIYLEDKKQQLDEVIVNGQLYNSANKTAISKSLSSAQIEAYSYASLGEILRELPGVSSLNSGANVSKPIIQGVHSSRVLVINDNVRLHDQQWGVEHAPNIDINSVANISIINGVSALKYGGDAVGGVIVTENTKLPLKDSIYGKTNFTGESNGRGGSANTQLNITRQNGFSSTIQASAQRLGDLNSPSYQLTNTGVSSKNFNINLNYNKIDHGFSGSYKYTASELGILRASHIGNASDLVNAINSQTPNFISSFSYAINNPKQDVTHQIFKLNAFKKIEGFGELTGQYAYQVNNRKEFDVRRGERANQASLDLELKTHTFKSFIEIDKFKKLSSQFGIDLTYQTNFANPNTQVKRLIPDYNMYNLGVIFTNSYKISDATTAEIGLRYDFNRIDAQKFYDISRWNSLDYANQFPEFEIEEFDTQILTNPVFNRHNFAFSIGGQHQFSKVSSLKAYLSQSSRAPNPSELFSEGLHHSIATIELGELSLKSEQSSKIGLEFDQTLQNFHLKLSPYYNLINNYILLEPSGIETTIRGAFPVFNYKQTDARIFGIDASFSYSFNHFKANTSIAYINGQETSGVALIDMPPLNITTGLGYKFVKLNHLSINLSHQAVFEQTQFPNNNFTINTTNPTTGNLETRLVDVSTPPEAYQLFNLNASVLISLAHKNDLRLSCSIENLTDVTYRNYLNRQRYYADETGRNILLQIQFNY